MDIGISNAFIALHKFKWLSYFMKFSTLLGEYGAFWIGVLTVTVVTVCQKNKKVPIVLLSIAVVALLGWTSCEFVLKNLIARVRPYRNEEVFGTAFLDVMTSVSYKLPHGYSFPSGHSFFAFYTALAMALYNKKTACVFYPIAVLIGVSRIYLGAHYFTDVVFGGAYGSALAIVAYFVGKKILEKLSAKNQEKYCR